MGTGGSKTYTSSIQTLNKVVNELIQSSVTNCSSSTDMAQSLNIVQGNNSDISITNTSFDLRLAQNVACIATMKLSSSQIQELNSKLAAESQHITEGIPEITIGQKQRTSIAVSVKNEIINRNVMNSIINSVQQNILSQKIATIQGDGSKFTMDNTKLSMAADIITKVSNEIITDVVNKVLADNNIDVKNITKDTPISSLGGAISGIIKSVGGVLSSMLMIWVVLAIAVLIFVAFNFDKIMAIFKMTPMGRALVPK